MKPAAKGLRLAAVVGAICAAVLPLTIEWAPRNWLDQQNTHALIASGAANDASARAV